MTCPYKALQLIHYFTLRSDWDYFFLRLEYSIFDSGDLTSLKLLSEYGFPDTFYILYAHYNKLIVMTIRIFFHPIKNRWTEPVAYFFCGILIYITIGETSTLICITFLKTGRSDLLT